MKTPKLTIEKMLDFSKPKPGFNYLTGWKDTPVINTKGGLEEVSLEAIKRNIKNNMK
jgi:hypothetical protein